MQFCLVVPFESLLADSIILILKMSLVQSGGPRIFCLEQVKDQIEPDIEFANIRCMPGGQHWMKCRHGLSIFSHRLWKSPSLIAASKSIFKFEVIAVFCRILYPAGDGK